MSVSDQDPAGPAPAPKQPGGPQPAPPMESLATSGLAITALVLGLLGCIPPLGIIALVLGIVAINQIDRPENRLTGRGIALAGAILGGINTIVLVPLLLISILLPALDGAHRNAQRMESNTRLRGIHLGMVQYAQGNKQKFPGLGKDNDPTVEGRYQILLDNNYVTPDWIISPLEADTKIPSAGPPLTTDNYSYSLLAISSPDGRRREWAAAANEQSPVISDRNTGSGPGALARSIHSTAGWHGGIAWNDNHVTFETSNILVSTRFGTSAQIQDDLFAAEGDEDAYMIYSGR